MSTLDTQWLNLWNGDYDVATTLVADGFRLHAAMLDGSDSTAVNNPQALVAWIQQTRYFIPDLTFSIEIGPLTDGDFLVVRWRARGHYVGGTPDAGAPDGAGIDFTGTDILRVHDGQLVEYWVNSDIHVMLAQLQVEGDVNPATGRWPM